MGSSVCFDDAYPSAISLELLVHCLHTFKAYLQSM